MKQIQAGALVRRQVRRFLLSEGVKFSEDKGWLVSVFYLDCSEEKARQINHALTEWQKQVEARSAPHK